MSEHLGGVPCFLGLMAGGLDGWMLATVESGCSVVVSATQGGKDLLST